MCLRGVKNSSRSTAVYIKRLPVENDVKAQNDLSLTLFEYTFNNTSITLDMYRNSCRHVVLDAIGVVQEDVFTFLRRSEYGDRDLTSLTLLPKTAVVKGLGSIISVTDTDNSKHLIKWIERKIFFFQILLNLMLIPIRIHI